MKRALMCLLFGVVFAVLLAGACRNNDEEQTADGNSPTPPAGGCEDNTAPTIAGTTLFVDGTAVGDNTFMATEAAELSIGFADAECNLGGGRVEYSLDALTTTNSRTLPTELPCDGSATDKLVGFTMPAAAVGSHVLLVNLSDRCGARSQTQSVAFTVTPYEPPGDDDTSPGDDDTTPSTYLTGTVSYVGEATDLEGRPVTLGLFTQWLPDGTWPTAWTQFDVPHGGLPFAYQWDLTGTAVVTGEYYLFAYLDLADGDGLINPAVDPACAPYVATTITEDETTTANLTLVSPTR